MYRELIEVALVLEGVAVDAKDETSINQPLSKLNRFIAPSNCKGEVKKHPIHRLETLDLSRC